MRLHPILVLLIASLVTCVFGKIHGAGPVYTVSLESPEESESHLNTRDAPNNLDYRCGPKIGKCPVGTCCSGAGKCQV
jgi:chitin deacetylase